VLLLNSFGQNFQGPDPDSEKMPDPDSINQDPQHWIPGTVPTLHPESKIKGCYKKYRYHLLGTRTRWIRNNLN